MDLKVYIIEHCWGCQEAQALAEEMRQEFPELGVEIIDLNGAGVEKPEAVFATPTFILDGRVVSLGNPKLEDLRGWIEEALQTTT